MTPRGIGNLFVVVWIATAILYDLVVYFGWGEVDATISRTLRAWGNWSPLLLVPLGGLLWHLWGVGRSRTWGSAWDWSLVAALVAGAILYALLGIGRAPDLGPPTRLP